MTDRHRPNATGRDGPPAATDGGTDSRPLFEHVLVPVASEADARTTCDALEPYLSGIDRVTAVHVVEKAGGAADKAPLEKRRTDAETFLGIVESQLEETSAIETEIAYGTDVVETIFETANAVEADSIAFHPRGGSRLVRLLTGDTAAKLVTEPAVPVVSLPTATED